MLLLRQDDVGQVEAAECVENMEEVQLKHLGHGTIHLARLRSEHEHQLSILAQPVDEPPGGIGHGWQFFWIKPAYGQAHSLAHIACPEIASKAKQTSHRQECLRTVDGLEHSQVGVAAIQEIV